MTHLFILPTYNPGQARRATQTAELARLHGFQPVIVCNSAHTAAALALNPFAKSPGWNTGYGSAAHFAAHGQQFETLVLCNDDLAFTAAAMSSLYEGAAQIAHDSSPAVIGLLPIGSPNIAALPGTLGVVALVSGISAITRRRRTREAQAHYESSEEGVQWLPPGLGFPFVCVALTRAAWVRLRGFDRHYPLYFEDLDLLSRAHMDQQVRVGVLLGDCAHARSSTSRTALRYVIPLMSFGAKNYLQSHRNQPEFLASFVVTIALCIRLLRPSPGRAQYRSQVYAIVKAIRAVWSRSSPPLPPWS